ncbi:hypothetical protein N7508_005006 [Penicillium antarcticum]|uniref:uncharacterized protein n=1 Tax=Penicillium antarcticum TaxID=416450 RepID=UPI00239EEF9C|nr:uncharacterized protein N7508_005006 [Penicillium antarcticum]KAJ5305991.1 hypothetical protein N7508_005006 [Penicillium antarcticum]
MAPDLETAEPKAATETSQQSLISNLRLRLPGQTAPFTHPFGHLKSIEGTIVDFDGSDIRARGKWSRAFVHGH